MPLTLHALQIQVSQIHRVCSYNQCVCKSEEGHCKQLQLEAYITLMSGTRIVEVGLDGFLGGGWGRLVITQTLEIPLQIAHLSQTLEET